MNIFHFEWSKIYTIRYIVIAASWNTLERSLI